MFVGPGGAQVRLGGAQEITGASDRRGSGAAGRHDGADAGKRSSSMVRHFHIQVKDTQFFGDVITLAFCSGVAMKAATLTVYRLVFGILQKALNSITVMREYGKNLVFIGVILLLGFHGWGQTLDSVDNHATDSMVVRVWSSHFQLTIINQVHTGFHAKYSGMNSLADTVEPSATSITTTLFLGRRLWRNAQLSFSTRSFRAGPG